MTRMTVTAVGGRQVEIDAYVHRACWEDEPGWCVNFEDATAIAEAWVNDVPTRKYSTGAENETSLAFALYHPEQGVSIDWWESHYGELSNYPLHRFPFALDGVPEPPAEA
ncbi:hypothetical protein [Agromyces humi]|uniref:hypothetical protein n=1 Tax=Agromyces humi TaxID=1766800 RepID=UPI001356C852|nr:hypothetical protein [Agromyces humi]